MVALAALVLLSLAPVLAQSGPSQLFFGYSRVALPLVVGPPLPTAVPTPVPTPDPRIVAWLDIPGKVRITDRMQIIVNVENQGATALNRTTEVIIPYDGRKFSAVDSSFDRGKGDWVRQNQFPTDLTVEFGPLQPGEHRRGVIYYDFRANGANAQVGDNLRIRARFNNGGPACGNAVCPTNERFVEVTDQFTAGGIGTLPPGSRQVQKLGTFRYGELHRWMPSGFRPGEDVTTWLNIAGGGTRPLTLQQRADSAGRVYFNIDVNGLRDGFYSIVAHGKDTRTEIVGEFQVAGSPITNLAALGARPVLLDLPAPATPSIAQALADETPRTLRAAGNTTLTGVVAAAGTAGATRLEGVQVNVVAADGSVVGATATDQFGGYVISGLAAGSYAVVFDPHFSFNAVTRRFQPQTQNAVTLPASGRLQRDAELEVGSSVSGRVLGANAGALAGVSVLLLDNAANVVEATTTTADGRYLLEGVPSATYTLLFDPATADDTAVRSFARATSAAFTVTAPTPRSGQDVTLERSPDSAAISGQVVGADAGAPLEGVFVAFERFDSATTAYVYAGLALTDATGTYSAVLTPGRYRVGFLPQFALDPTSERYLEEYFDDAAPGETPAELDLAGGATVRADAALALGGTISGNVSGGGAPLAGVVVFAATATDATLSSVALTDEHGDYTLPSLPAGNYRMTFAPALSTDPTSRTFAGATRSAAVAVSGGARVQGIDATLEPGGAIGGAVTSSAGGALESVLVLAIDPQDAADPNDDTLAGLALTAANGTYTLPGLATGAYTVAFITELTGSPDVAAHFDQVYNGKTDLSTADPVSVTAGQTTPGIDATLVRGGQLRGVVRDAESGVAISGVFVEIFAADAPDTLVAFAVTDEVGAYATTALTPGASYIVRFDPVLNTATTGYAAEYYANAADAAAATQVAVPGTTPVVGIDGELDRLP
jgi:hypothetical protein